MTSRIQQKLARPISKSSTWCIVAVVATLVSFSVLASQTARADTYRAFYYDAQGKLLQVENVPDAELANRNLVDVNQSALVVPLLTGKDFPMISGLRKMMNKSAELAVYYTFNKSNPPNSGDKDVQALPSKVEYLGFIEKRLILECLPRDGATPCIFPKRCHCMTGSCCCY